MLIYIIEDDAAMGSGMKFMLEKEGYETRLFGTAGEGKAAVWEQAPDLILMDWNLPDGDGLKICREIKKMQDIPVLMITARDMEIDQVMCLEEGADDYVSKPFSLAVLKARIAALLRRSGKNEESLRVLRSGEIRLNENEMKAYKREEALELSLTEFRLLRYLMENKNQVLLKEQILQRIWDDAGVFVEENTLPVNIRRLRKKIEEDPARPRYIKTIHGIGYLWEESRDE